MKQLVQSISILILISISFSSVADSTVFLVRHAEKQTDAGKDPALTEQGKQRAINIAALLSNKNITAIYSTDYQRTQQTAAPLAQKLGIKVLSYDPGKLSEFAESIKSSDKNVLIVGHSNTTPALVVHFGGESHGDIDESEYDRLYQLELSDKDVKTTLLHSSPSKN